MSRRHAGVQGGTLHLLVDEPQRQDERDDAAPLTWPENPAAHPYLDGQGHLVLPLDCDQRFRWWAGGQTVKQTMMELRHGSLASALENAVA